MQNKIKFYRQQLGMTQAELADKVGVRRETIVFLEQGKYNPSLQLAAAVSKTLNSHLETIFDLE